MDQHSDARATLVLVTHNEKRRVSELITALLGFTSASCPWVCVDNNSQDGTRALLRDLVGMPGFTLIENEENVRCARATNEAIELCRTQYVIYLCASHALVTDAGWDRSLVRFMDEHEELAIAGDVWNPYGFLLPSKRYRPGWTPERHGRESLLHVQGGAWIARRSLFLEVGGFADDEYPHGGTDVEFSYRVLSHGRPLGRHPAIASPPAPEQPELRRDVCVYHPASERLREQVRLRLRKQLSAQHG